MEKPIEHWAKHKRSKECDSVQWGHGGYHFGNGSKDCPLDYHHHHDQYCPKPKCPKKSTKEAR